ncbi:unnamed protein product [Cuscuta campestris]|uniref:F-box domain-containing protein n=1 Tax=Cuscuta campestris TaxID=132261 RepID=A0A484LRK9_9ASTE|nr:unnamed protein product [Cuscuta campestris]
MSAEASLDALPEGCIADALSLTSPRDACRLSLIASAFRSAAMSDAVWERFLPPDYRDIISRSADAADLLASASKKDLYFRLCDFPVLIDGDTMSFSLEKKSGKKCYMIGARSLKIVWSDTPAYWKWISHPHSRFAEVAELLDVCWLEISGTISMTFLSPNTTYAAYLVFALLPSARGFDYHRDFIAEYNPVSAAIEIKINGDDEDEAKKEQGVFLSTREDVTREEYRPMILEEWGHRCSRAGRPNWLDPGTENNAPKFPKRRSHAAWMEVEIGEFFVKDGGQHGEIVMSLMEVRAHWKSGLIVEGIEIRPKE